MRFLSTVSGPENGPPPPPEHYAAIEKLTEDGFKSGILVSVGGLKPSAQGFRARIVKGKVVITDGPFTESKEVLGGWAIYELKSKAEAVEWSRRFLETAMATWPGWEGTVEIREMYDAQPMP